MTTPKQTPPRRARQDDSQPVDREAVRPARREIMGGTVLLVVASLLLALVLTGGYRTYLQEWFGPYLLVAAIIIGLLGLWTVLEAADCPSPTDHSHGIPKIGALLLVPVALVGFARPGALGAEAATELAAPQPVSSTPVSFTPLASDSVTELSVLEYVQRYRFGDPELLVGKPVRLLGFVAQQNGLAAGQWSVNRFQIFCCVADASLVTVAVTGVEPPAGENIWVEVEGVVDLEASGEIPVLKVTSVKVVAEPEDPYL